MTRDFHFPPNTSNPYSSGQRISSGSFFWYISPTPFPLHCSIERRFFKWGIQKGPAQRFPPHRPPVLPAWAGAHNTFLFSEPGVVTITCSGVMTRAPFAVAAPWNICSTMALKVSTRAPWVTYTAVPLI